MKALGATSTDLENCAREPIHLMGSIQPHGWLFAVSEFDFIVRFVSANLADELAIAAEQIIGSDLPRFLGTAYCDRLREAIDRDDFSRCNPTSIAFGCTDRIVECVAHRHKGMLFVEMQPEAGAHARGPLNFALDLLSPIARICEHDELSALVRVAAREFALLTGFDRVMIYQFDPDWNGQVIAEAGGAPPSYLGLHFPASDIPAQARRLYLENTLRTIVDVNAVAVPLVPDCDPNSALPLDLSHAQLRSASSVHLTYLQNMGVRATLTISLIVRGNLWGLVAAHHPIPHRIDYTTRAVCEVLAQVLETRIDLRTNVTDVERRLAMRDALEAYMSSLEAAELPLPGDATHLGRLVDVFGADGLIARIDGREFHSGTTLCEADLLPVIRKLHEHAARGIASCDALVTLDPAAAAYAPEASGALLIGLAEDDAEYVLLVRRELLQTLTWAGNPGDKMVDPDTGSLNPRASFAAWQEIKRGSSRRWTDLEREQARLLREQLLQLREARYRHDAEARARHLAEHDALTGLPNRRSIGEMLARRLGEAHANESHLAILFVDLDRFKSFNDRLGHAAGDRILQIVAARMQHVFRGDDVVGRLGGDEFVVILPGIVTDAEAADAAARVLAAISQPLEIAQSETLSITASIGIGRYPNDGESADALLDRSDARMYQIKARGGNGFAD